jgi:ribonuclease VapC
MGRPRRSREAARLVAAAYVLDASALLALLKQEPGGDRVMAVLASGAAITSVNLAEVAAVLIRDGHSPAETARRVMQGVWSVEAVDTALALRSAELFTATRPAGLSLGDRVCLALADRERCPALTADRSWAGLNLGIAVELIR